MKEGASKESRRVVSSGAQLKLLLDERALDYLAPFLGAEHTLTSAANALGVAPSTVAHWLPKLIAADLLKVVRRQRRAGMASPVYRATADAFVIRASAVDRAVFTTFIDRAARSLDERMRSSLDSLDPYRNVVMELRREPVSNGVALSLGRDSSGGPPGVAGFEVFEGVQLDPEVALSFQAELIGLIERFKGLPGTGRSYVIRVALSPTRLAPSKRTTGARR